MVVEKLEKLDHVTPVVVNMNESIESSMEKQQELMSCFRICTAQMKPCTRIACEWLVRAMGFIIFIN